MLSILRFKMILPNTKIICALLVIFITLGKGNQNEVEVCYEDAKMISQDRIYYWKDWCFCQETDYLYIWSESAVLKLYRTSNGWFDVVIDGKSFTKYPIDERRNGISAEYIMEKLRSLINSTTHTQPILSHAGCTEIVFGTWFLISRKEGEMIIQCPDNQFSKVITLQDDFPGFKFKFGSYSNKTFAAKTRMGAEFSTSWIPGRKTNQIENQNKNNPDNALTVIQCNTDTSLHHISYIWNINNVHFHRPEESNHSILSPTFSSDTNDKAKWYLEINPGMKYSNHMGLYLHLSRESEVSKIMAKYTVYFFDNKQNLMKTRCADLNIYENHGNGRGWDNIPLSEVISLDNKLRMVWNITFCESTNSVSCGNRTNSPSNHKCNLTLDFVPSIKNNEFPDIVLVLSKTGKEYPANRTILAARSPVFATMFNVSRTEKDKKIDRVNITDVDSEQVFDKLLKYIYTSRCENIDNFTSGLLVAALKYKLDGLKTICFEKIRKNLTVENAVDTLVFADEHGVDELKSKVIRFIAANYPQVSNTSDWNQIIKTNSKFVHEVCQILSNYLGNEKIAEE